MTCGESCQCDECVQRRDMWVQVNAQILHSPSPFAAADGEEGEIKQKRQTENIEKWNAVRRHKEMHEILQSTHRVLFEIEKERQKETSKFISVLCIGASLGFWAYSRL